MEHEDHYRVKSQVNSIHTTPIYIHKIHFNIIHRFTFWSSYLSFFPAVPQI
jgi:hypothetical protein